MRAGRTPCPARPAPPPATLCGVMSVGGPVAAPTLAPSGRCSAHEASIHQDKHSIQALLLPNHSGLITGIHLTITTFAFHTVLFLFTHGGNPCFLPPISSIILQCYSSPSTLTFSFPSPLFSSVSSPHLFPPITPLLTSLFTLHSGCLVPCPPWLAPLGRRCRSVRCGSRWGMRLDGSYRPTPHLHLF